MSNTIPSISRSLAVLTTFTLLLACVSIPVISNADTLPTLTALETVANVSASTIPAVTTSGGSNAIAASGLLTSVTKANLANNDSFILSNTNVAGTSVCFYFDVDNTIASDAATSAACQAADGVAGGREIAVSAATDAISTAALIHAAINAVTTQLTVTSTNNGNGTLTLTNDTAGVAGNVSVNAAYWSETVTNAGFTLAALTGGTDAITAATTITITDALVGSATDHSVNVDGLGAIDLGTSALTAAQVAAAIRAGVTGAGGYAAKTYGVTGAGANIIFTQETAGSAGNVSITLTDASYGAKAQVVTFTPANIQHADFTITLGGTGYLYAADAASSVSQVVEGLNALLAGNGAATCTENDLLVSCTALSAGTAFTYSTTVAAVTTNNSHHGGGGGGGSSSSSSSSSASTSNLQSMIDSLKAQIAALIAQAGGSTSAGTPVSAAFARDLEVGSTGADVMSLQAYLNAHSAVVAATGAGSVGHETMTFGPATQAALMKFQAAAGITPASGYFGPKTRAYVQAH